MLMFSASDWWQHAIDPNDMIEIIIHNDREYFRKLQPVWDEMEAKNPGWVRPKATTEEEYQRWRKQHSKVDDDWQTIQPLEPVNASATESADSANKISEDSQ